MFLALDKDMNGTLSKQELREYADGTLTDIFIERGRFNLLLVCAWYYIIIYLSWQNHPFLITWNLICYSINGKYLAQMFLHWSLCDSNLKLKLLYVQIVLLMWCKRLLNRNNFIQTFKTISSIETNNNITAAKLINAVVKWSNISLLSLCIVIITLYYLVSRVC